jgi:hypothetical protein
MSERVVVRLELTPAAGFSGDPMQRLKRWLKMGLRVFGWRVTVGVLSSPTGAVEALDAVGGRSGQAAPLGAGEAGVAS